MSAMFSTGSSQSLKCLKFHPSLSFLFWSVRKVRTQKQCFFHHLNTFFLWFCQWYDICQKKNFNTLLLVILDNKWTIWHIRKHTIIKEKSILHFVPQKYKCWPWTFTQLLLSVKRVYFVRSASSLLSTKTVYARMNSLSSVFNWHFDT